MKIRSTGASLVGSLFTFVHLAGAVAAQLPTTWTAISATGLPPARTDYAVAVVPSAAPWLVPNQLMVYGGKDGAGVALAQTWLMDLSGPTANTWAGAGSSTNPGARWGHSMVYDPTRGGVVLFGGVTAAGVMSDTWFWSGFAWGPLALGGATPVARYDHDMVFDSSTGDIVCFGGRDALGNAIPAGNATMTLRASLNQWVAQAPMLAPPARWGQGMAFDSVRERVVLFGGLNGATAYNDVWQYETATSTWTQHTQAQSISGGGRAEAAYDLARGRTVFFSAAGPASLHEFDGVVAVPRNGPTATPSNAASAFGYDPSSKSCYYYAAGQGATWRYAPTTVSNVASTGSSGCATSNNQALVLRPENGNEWQSAASALPRNVVMSNLVASTPSVPVFAGLLASLTTTSVPLGPCLQLIDSPTSFPIQVVDFVGTDLRQSFGFPAGYVGVMVHYQFAMLDPVVGTVLSNRLSVTAGSTL
jgi:hypothetical protein